jgi:hypothetical protein
MAQVLFCPFCGEAFEGEAQCPEHELLLQPWDVIARARAAPRDDETLPWYSPRAGRGWVFAGVGVVLVAFALLPLAHAAVGAQSELGGSMLTLALHGAPRLWLIPIAGWAELVILRRRTTRLSMRRARAAVAFVACVPFVALGWAFASIRDAVALLAAQNGAQFALSVAAGAYAVACGSALMLAGGLRLGVVAQRGPRLVS